MARQHFAQTLLKMFEDQVDCDTYFSCPNNVSENSITTTIGAHKRILATASEVFNAMFYGQMAKSIDDQPNNEISIPDIEIMNFKLLLSFIYGKEIKFENIQMASDFYYAAAKYICKDAIKCVSDYLMGETKPENSIFIYEIASDFDNDELKAAAKEKFSGKIFDGEEIFAAKPETVEEIYKQEILHANSEIVLIKALERYIEHNKARDPEIAVKMRPALFQIRFLTLIFKDIIQTTLLTHEEKVGILEGLEPNESLLKMPEGFSTNRIKRQNSNVLAERRKIIAILKRIYQKKYDGLGCVFCSKNHAVWKCKSVTLQKRLFLQMEIGCIDNESFNYYSNKDLKALYNRVKDILDISLEP